MWYHKKRLLKHISENVASEQRTLNFDASDQLQQRRRQRLRESGGFYFDGFTVSEREREREREKEIERERKRERGKKCRREI